MHEGPPSRQLKLYAEEIAAAWLLAHGYCDCAIQQQTVSRRILPAVAMFERELDDALPEGLALTRDRLAIYLTRRHDDLCKGLHRPGASAAVRHHGRLAGTDDGVN